MLSHVTRIARSRANITAKSLALKLQTFKALSTLALPPTPNGHAAPGTEPYIVGTYINNENLKSDATEWIDVRDPATDVVIAKCPESTNEELDLAIQAATDAFQTFKEMSLTRRNEILFRYIELLKENKDRLAAIIVAEQGKSWSAAVVDVYRGIQCAEHATQATKELEAVGMNLSAGIDTLISREPIGVVSSILPFNFPVMIPLWTIPYIIATGNTTVMKPSELCPGSGAILADLAAQAGVPAGVINMVHGSHNTVNKLITDPRIKAVTFVGGNNAGKHVYDTATKCRKKVQINLGAKNHTIILPDADKESVLKAVVSGGFTSTGQVCLSTDILLLVGEAKKFIPDIIETVKTLQAKPGFEDGAFGPVVTKQSKERIEAIIADAEAKGAKIHVDGRYDNKPTDALYENGYFVGPTFIEGVHPGMRCVDEEVFGPFITSMEIESMEKAIEYVNNNQFGNSVAIFTKSGSAAYHFQKAVNIGQVGINSIVPIGHANHGFTSNKASFLGDLPFYGPSQFTFLTQPKTVISSWKDIPYENK